MSHTIYQRTILVLLLFFILFRPVSFSADFDRSIRFSHLTNDDGLPSNTIYSICQDYKGFIWIATRSGLCRYDGKTITPYEIEAEKGKRVLGGQIRYVFEDHQQRLWIVSYLAVNLYDRDKDRFFYVGTEEYSRYRRMLYQGRDNKIYVAGEKLLTANEDKKQIEPYYLADGETINATTSSITSGKNGYLWLGRVFAGLICLDVENGKIINRYAHNPNDENSLISNRIMALYTDKRGNIWIGTEDKGVCCYNDEEKSLYV